MKNKHTLVLTISMIIMIIFSLNCILMLFYIDCREVLDTLLGINIVGTIIELVIVKKYVDEQD